MKRATSFALALLAALPMFAVPHAVADLTDPIPAPAVGVRSTLLQGLIGVAILVDFPLLLIDACRHVPEGTPREACTGVQNETSSVLGLVADVVHCLLQPPENPLTCIPVIGGAVCVSFHVGLGGPALPTKDPYNAKITWHLSEGVDFHYEQDLLPLAVPEFGVNAIAGPGMFKLQFSPTHITDC
jgi:hypothetical protein